MKIALHAAAAALMAILVGCASIGLTQPKSLSERIAYGYGVNAGVRTAAANSLQAGTLSREDGEYVLAITDQTRGYLDAARVAAGAGDVSTAEGRLLLALSVLDEIQRHLARQVKP